MESLSSNFSCGWRGDLEMTQEWFLKKGTGGLILAAQERTLKTNSAWITPLKHYCVGCAETPLTQYGIFSVGAGSLPKENTGSATTRWLYGYTGSCVESMSWSVTTKMVRPSALISCRESKSQDNLGQDYLHREEA